MSKKFNKAIKRKSSKLKIFVKSAVTEAKQIMTPNKETCSNLKSFANFGANEVKPSSPLNDDNSIAIAIADICVNYLKNIFPHETIQNKKALTKSKKFSFEKREVEILKNLKYINIKHFKSSLEKEDQDVIEMFCSVLFIKDIDDITETSWPDIMSRIYNKNVSRDLQEFYNSQKSNPDLEYNIIIHNSYINFDPNQQATLNSYILGKKDLITIIDFTGNKLENEGTKNLMMILKELHHLSTLIISDNNIGISGAISIALNLGDTSLKTLDLSKNHLSKGGANVILISLLDPKITLKKLNISFNKIDDTMRKKSTIDLFNTYGYYYLKDEYNSLKEQIDNIFCKYEKNSIMQLLLNTIITTQLEALDISNNKIGSLSTELVILDNVTSQLKELYISNNDMSEKSTNILLKALSRIEYLESFDIIGNNFSIEDGIEIKKQTQKNLINAISIISELINNLHNFSRDEKIYSSEINYIKPRIINNKINIELFEKILSKMKDEDRSKIIDFLEKTGLKDEFYQPLNSDFLIEIDELMKDNLPITTELNQLSLPEGLIPLSVIPI